MLDWLNEHRGTLWLIAASLALGLVGLIAGLVVVVRMPPDALEKQHKGGSPTRRIIRNIAGWLLILAGLAMLVLPGPGLVVALLGIALADFPGKHRLQHWILSRKHVVGPINRLRKRFNQPPLKIPPQAKKTTKPRKPRKRS